MSQDNNATGSNEYAEATDPYRQAPPPPHPHHRYHGYHPGPPSAPPPAPYDGQGYASSGPYSKAIHYGSAAGPSMPYRPHYGGPDESSSPLPHYGPPPGPGGPMPHHYGAPDNSANPFRPLYPVPDDAANPPPTQYGPPRPAQSFPGGHMPYHYVTHPLYSSNRIDDSSRTSGMRAPQPQSSDSFNDVDRKEGATSPTQIEMSHRDEVTNMGCTCKKTKCLKLYCQCFAVKIYCGGNCRCLVCLNTAKHDKQRKDAMRNILSRNPSAFDTKFSKTKERKAKEQQLVLAHKLGCKCRKSACLKKYCECYAGNVKCSANCRCVGCKNTPPGGFGPRSGVDNCMAVRDNGGMVTYEMPLHAGARVPGREPWMMNAAHNLTFLKHGSPAAEKRATMVHDAGEVASMPSLTASDISPEDKHDEVTKVARVSADDTDNGGAVNTLLMAAYAMTEFQARGASIKAESPEDTKPAADTGSLGTPKKQGSAISRKELFRASPKRKSELAVEEEIPQTESAEHMEKVGESADSDNLGIAAKGDAYEMEETTCTPSDQRQMKRTRLGSVRKKNIGEDENASANNFPGGMVSVVNETPNKTSLKPDTLTPVSARCIDFRRMQVNEKQQ